MTFWIYYPGNLKGKDLVRKKKKRVVAEEVVCEKADGKLTVGNYFW